jgi:hypothetical protein
MPDHAHIEDPLSTINHSSMLPSTPLASFYSWSRPTFSQSHNPPSNFPSGGTAPPSALAPESAHLSNMSSHPHPHPHSHPHPTLHTPPHPNHYSHYHARYPHHGRWGGGVFRRFFWVCSALIPSSYINTDDQFGTGAAVATWYIRSKEYHRQEQILHSSSDSATPSGRRSAWGCGPNLAGSASPTLAPPDHPSTPLAVSPAAQEVLSEQRTSEPHGRPWGWKAARARRDEVDVSAIHKRDPTPPVRSNVDERDRAETRIKDAIERVWAEKTRQTAVQAKQDDQVSPYEHVRSQINTL